MIGIYVFTNLINGKQYVGQSVNITHRINQHMHYQDIHTSALEQAMRKYGNENFKVDIVELCDPEQLDEREQYWINVLDTYRNGYNCTLGGDGSRKTQHLYSVADVTQLRIIYRDHTYNSINELYAKYGKGNLQAFRQIFVGKLWSWVMPEVFTEENLRYYLQQKEENRRTNHQWGENNTATILTNELVFNIRLDYSRFVREEIFKKYSNISQRTITSIISGQNWRNLPIYHKRQRYWEWPKTMTIEEKSYYEQKIEEYNNGWNI